jgi:hypothetical protein
MFAAKILKVEEVVSEPNTKCKEKPGAAYPRL